MASPSPPLEPLPKTPATARGVLAAPPLGGLSVFRVPCLRDNYAWVLVDAATGAVAVVDPAEAAPVSQFIEAELGGRLDFILNTHHHGDHVGGNEALCERFGATVVGAACDAKRIPRIGVRLSEGEKIKVGEAEAIVLETPGHTSGHIAFWFEKGKALFPVSLHSFLFFPVSCFSFRGVLVSRRSTTTLLQNASPKKKLF
jgi:glyoxylase-like metal-dependent hydrolase (beta-lactamase superfamily II)